MSRLDDIFNTVISLERDKVENFMATQDIRADAKHQIKDLMLSVYQNALLEEGDVADNFIKAVREL